MPLASSTERNRSRYHHQAYQFIFEALRYTQETHGKGILTEAEEESAHISGPELLEGIKQLARKNFGMMARTVFRQWGVNETVDFGHIVFEMIERGEMQKTEEDCIEDFADVYNFDDAFDLEYDISLDHVSGS